MLASNLKKIREEMKLSKAAFAKLLNIPYTTYNGYETGERQPNYEKLQHIANTLNVSVMKLLGWEDKYNSWTLHDITEENLDENVTEDIFAFLPVLKIEDAAEKATNIFLSEMEDIPDEYLKASILDQFKRMNKKGKWILFFIAMKLDELYEYKRKEE